MNTTHKEPRLDVSAFDWRELVGPETDDDSMDGKGSAGAPLALCATMAIGPANFHVEALLAEYRATDKRGNSRLYRKPTYRENEAIELRRNDEVTSWLWQAHGMDGLCETVKIPGIGKGREYAVFIHPFCR